jgi:hypothetical protein
VRVVGLVAEHLRDSYEEEEKQHHCCCEVAEPHARRSGEFGSPDIGGERFVERDSLGRGRDTPAQWVRTRRVDGGRVGDLSSVVGDKLPPVQVAIEEVTPVPSDALALFVVTYQFGAKPTGGITPRAERLAPERAPARAVRASSGRR